MVDAGRVEEDEMVDTNATIAIAGLGAVTGYGWGWASCGRV